MIRPHRHPRAAGDWSCWQDLSASHSPLQYPTSFCPSGYGGRRPPNPPSHYFSPPWLKAFCRALQPDQANSPVSQKNSAAIAADAGIVMIQATTMLLATLQRTADTLRAAPTPMIEPVIV